MKSTSSSSRKRFFSTGAASTPRSRSSALQATSPAARPIEREPRSRWPEPDDLTYLAALFAASLVFYLVPLPEIYLPALAVFGALGWRRLDLALLPVVLLSPLFMLPKGLGRHDFPPAEVLLGIDTLCCLAYLPFPARRRSLAWDRLVRSPFLKPSAVLILGAAISTFAAADRHDAVDWSAQMVVEPIIFFALVVLAARPSFRFLLLGTIAATGAYLSVIALAQAITHQGLTAVPGSSVQRVRSVYGSADNLGLNLDRVIPLWLAACFYAAGSRIGRLGWLAVGPVLVAALILSYSRGAWAAVAIGALLVLAALFRWGKWIALACVLVVIAGAAVKGPALASSLRSGHAGTVQRRVDIWRSSVHMLRDHPIVGVGPDNFLHYYAPRSQTYIPCAHGLGYMEPEAWPEPCLSHPHDEFLDFWLSTGILGLAAFLWLQVAFWRWAYLLWRDSRFDTSDRYLVVGAASAMLAALVHGLVDNSYFLPDLAIAFWVLCALVDLTAEARRAASPSHADAAA